MNVRALLVAASLAVATAPALANESTPALRDAAKDVVVAFMENFNAGNVEGMASTYSDGGTFIWVENGRVVSDSKAHAVEAAKKMPLGARMETESSMQVVAIGDAAAEAVVPFRFFMKDEKGVEAELFAGVMTMAIAPDPDGAWRIVAGHMSSSGRE